MFADARASETPEWLWSEREKLLGEIVKHLRKKHGSGGAAS
jgi:hypothetical protein